MTGRPRGNSDARDALIRAATDLFADRGVDGVSVREVAERAGVTPAMVNYYFGGKRGLSQAVLEKGLDHLLEVLEKIAAESGSDIANRFTERYVSTLIEEPALPQLMVREVLSGNPAYQDIISARFVARAMALLPPRIADNIRTGQLRDDLDPRFMMMSLVGMCVFPFIAAPLLQPVLRYELDDAFAATLIRHTQTLFMEGARHES